MHIESTGPNVYIKIPATTPCIPSIKEVNSLGITVIVTESLCYASAITFFFFYTYNGNIEKDMIVLCG